MPPAVCAGCGRRVEPRQATQRYCGPAYRRGTAFGGGTSYCGRWPHVDELRTLLAAEAERWERVARGDRNDPERPQDRRAGRRR